ncbi:hypothetical protein IJT93_06730 [bacterium]|nr:hypothetical protein [bacterium]
MHIKRIVSFTAAVLLFTSLSACGPSITTAPRDFQLGEQKIVLAPPPDNWECQNSKPEKIESKSGEPAVLRYISKADPGQFISVASVSFGDMTGWSQDPKKTEEVVRGFQNQILKRSEAQILAQKQISLSGEDALQLTYTYLEGTTKVWGSQVYAFHEKKLWNISCSCAEKNRSETEAVLKHVLKTFEFK